MKSANTLFHYTNTLDNLKGILKNGIFVRYSLESFDNLIQGQGKVLFPMACFCDISLSNIKFHTQKYGCYSIGLSKEWGKANNLSPVIYSHDNSHTSKMLNQLNTNLEDFLNVKYDKPLKIKEILEETSKRGKEYNQLSKKLNELQAIFSHLIKFIKPYEGIGYSNGREIGEINFYDEREWRFVPTKELLKELQIKDSFQEDVYHNDVKRRRINMKLAKHKKLTFSPSDIRFIIVREVKEVPEIIKFLNNLFENKISTDERYLLSSKIISLEQVIQDI